jgi:hypothetical protein
VHNPRIAGYRLVTGRLTACGIELHVLARAYRAAWVALHSEPPTGCHRLADLGIAIDFGAGKPKRRLRSARSRKTRLPLR